LKLRVINAGTTSPLYSQAVYHGIADQITANDAPVLVLVKPDKPYICIGLHQQLDGEINSRFCADNNIPIIRRHVGGGTVLLDSNQVFFQYIFPKQKAPNQPAQLYPYLLQGVLQTYHHFGIPASLKKLNDIQVCNKKIGGTGAGSIHNATVLVGSFLFDFNPHLMAQCVNSPSALFTSSLTAILAENITTINAQLTNAPTHEALIAVFLKNTEKWLDVELEYSEPSPREKQAIKIAERRLSDVKWLHIENQKLLANGVKIAADVYLLETSLPFCAGPLTIRLKYCAGNIDTIWLESDEPRLQASLAVLCDNINNRKPAISHEIIHEMTLNAVSGSGAIDEKNAISLANAIFQLACVNAY